MPTSTSMSISQSALRVSGLQGLQVGSGQGGRMSGVRDQGPDLAVGVVGVVVDDARSSGTWLGRSRASSGAATRGLGRFLTPP